MQWIFCAACTKYNKAQLNSSYVNVFFEIYGLLKMLFCHFRKFDFSNLKSTFVRWLMKKFFRFLWRIFKVLYWRLFEYFSILHKSPFSLLIIVCFAMERCNYSRVIIYMACKMGGSKILEKISRGGSENFDFGRGSTNTF